MLKYNTRQEMIAALKIRGVVAELGVFKGDFSQDLLTFCDLDKLYLIDIWSGILMSGNQDGNNVEYYNGDDLFTYVNVRFKYNSKVKIGRMFTTEFLSQVPDKSLDAVYIDADHSYEGVKNDLLASFAKVKPGGWIMGHDYMVTSKSTTKWEFGVKQAVDEFCTEKGLEIHALALDGCVSYAIKLSE